MLRKEKPGLATPSLSPRPVRKSIPITGLSPRPIRRSLPSPCPSPTAGRKVSISDKRKTSRVHLGRMNYLTDYSNEEEPDPVEPVSVYDFFTAASCGMIKAATKYLDDGGDVNVVDSCKRTALHRASLYEQVAIAELLISRGADVNKADKLNNTPLHWACRGTSMEIVQLLLANKAKVNAKDALRSSPLHVATRVGFVECVDYLIECGAKLNEKDSEGDTPIHDAIRLGRPKVVRSLILHGTDMDTKNMGGKTAADMVLSWYNNTKEALSSAEKERRRKMLDTEKVAEEMEKEGGKDAELQKSSKQEKKEEKKTKQKEQKETQSVDIVIDPCQDSTVVESENEVVEESKMPESMKQLSEASFSQISKDDKQQTNIEDEANKMKTVEANCATAILNGNDKQIKSSDIISEEDSSKKVQVTEDNKSFKFGNSIQENGQSGDQVTASPDKEQTIIQEANLSSSNIAQDKAQAPITAATNDKVTSSQDSTNEVDSFEEFSSTTEASCKPPPAVKPPKLHRRVSVEAALSERGQQGLSKMEEETPKIKEKMAMIGTRILFS